MPEGVQGAANSAGLLAQLQAELATARQTLEFWQAQPVSIEASFTSAVVPGRIQWLKANIAEIEQSIARLEQDDASNLSAD
ncbi:MAG TPA: hypothetical protein VHX92_08070 [Rhizomicrobium sp.]|jgi:hypothetical protein|nr:hypothetical protein [Rhizomicrobium sp.]